MRIVAVLAATCQVAIGQATISQAATAKNIGSIHVGPWTGGAFTEKAGEFGFCAATAPVEGDYVLTIGQNADRFWVLAITHSDWGLKRSEKLSLDLTFDGQSPISFKAAAKKRDHAIGLLSEEAAERFRHARSMTVSGTVQAGPLTLQDTDKLMSVISFCVDRVKAGGLAAADVDFAALSKNAPAPAAAGKNNPTPAGAERVNVAPAEGLRRRKGLRLRKSRRPPRSSKRQAAASWSVLTVTWSRTIMSSANASARSMAT